MKTYPPLVLLFALLQGWANMALADAVVRSSIRYEAAAASHPIVLSWPAIPGSGYLIQAVPELGSPWETLTASPLWASTHVMNWSEAADRRSRFYQVLQLDGNLTLQGQVTDALNATPLAGVTVTAGGCTVVTDANGAYAITNLSAGSFVADFTADVRSGKTPVTVHFLNLSTATATEVALIGAKPGYFTYTNAQVGLNAVEPTRLDFSLSPVAVGKLRFVLNWGARPKDLDVHLVTPSIGGKVYEIYYGPGHRGDTNAPPYAQLDVDRTAGFGPETITIERFEPGNYLFYVHNYQEEQGDTGELRDAGAVVSVYSDLGLVQTIRIPTTGEGNYWEVCTIDGATGKLTVVNAIGGIKPASLKGAGSGEPGILARAARSGDIKATGFLWAFGDGTQSQEENPVKTYVPAGDYDVSLQVTFADGRIGNITKQRFITAFSAPQITQQPQSQTVVQGSNVTLTVVASGSSPLSYQWSKDENALSAQTNASLGLVNVQSADAGDYTVIVSNPAGTVTSQKATLTVKTDQPVPIAGMVAIPAGTFMMGSPATEVDRYDNEGPQTRVTLTQAFWMSKYETTQREYLAVMRNNPSWHTGDLPRPADLQRPVECVSWYDATDYCGKLTARERAAGRLPVGYVYRLPTEAEWEYCCRAGTTTRFSYGDDPAYTQLASYEYCGVDTADTTHPVGEKLPNPWGLFDMHGNVCEWCLDSYGSYPGGSVTDPRGPTTGSSRVIRGGSWCEHGRTCRSADRSTLWPSDRDYTLGFRPVLAPGQ